MIAAPGVPFIAVDSAQVMATVYAASLLATLPVVAAAMLGLALRRVGADGRILVWRSALVALLAMFIGRQLSLHWAPLHWLALVVPSSLAAPLIALGRVEVTSHALRSAGAVALDGARGARLVQILFAAYATGVVLVLLPMAIAWLRMRAILGRARPLLGGWRRALVQTCAERAHARGTAPAARLLVSRDVAVPMTCGILRPVVLIPEHAVSWPAPQRRMVLTHELAHVGAADTLFKLLTRIVCALYWVHPGVWWLARRLDADCEIACDDRVIATGARRSDYAELLISAADRAALPRAALALSARGGLRARLATVLDTRHSARPVGRGWSLIAAASTLVIAGPMSAVQLAPSRDMLTALLRDARWESRAYAVIGLAARPDSVAVARSAAVLDPNPRVRAWARYALDRQGATTGLPALLDR